MAIPVTIADARRQVRLDADDTSLDADLNDFIADAAAWVEKYTGHILVAREVTEVFRGFRMADLQAWPIKAGAVASLSYTDTTGAPATHDNVPVNVAGRCAWIFLAPAVDTAAPRDQMISVTVRAGYEPTDEVPGNIRRAMLIMISAYDSDREGGDIFQKAEASARRLCTGFRRRVL